MKYVSKITYPAGYRPQIFYADVEISFYHNRYRELAKEKPDLVKKMHLDSITSKEMVITLDDNGFFPSQDLHDTKVREVWKNKMGTKDIREYMAWISQIKPHFQLGRTNYTL